MATAASCAAAAVAGRRSPADQILSFKRSELSGPCCTGSSHLASSATLIATSAPSTTQLPPFRLNVVAKGKKLNVKNPFGPSGGTKFQKGTDANGSKAKGKGLYQFSSKYGANVDGYSPIYTEEEWATSGGVYAGGQAGLALWALTFGALLVAGALLVYNTSSLA